jgi:ABC-2 type transport system permease protein
MTALQAAAYHRLAGHTFAEHAAFGYLLSIEAVTGSVLLPPPVRPETVAGYLELRAFEPLAILFAAWAIVSATASTSRPTVPQAAAFATSVTVAAAAACLGVLIGVTSAGESVGGLGVVEAGVLLIALATACYAIGLVVAQISPAPTLVGGGLLLALFFLNSLSRVFTQQLASARWLSPFRYYDLSTPLPTGGRFDVGGLAMLLAIATLGAAVATAFPTPMRASEKLRGKTFEPLRARLLALPVVRDLYPQRIALAAWCVAFAVMGIVLVAAARTSMQDLLVLPRGLPGLPQYIFVFYAQVLDQTWLEVALLMLVALAFSFVARWAADDRDGRLEAVLSAPYSRSAVVLERLGALGLSAITLAAIGAVAVALMSHALSLSLDSTRLAEACLLLILFAVSLGAAGSYLTSSVTRAALPLFGAVTLAAYLDDQIGGALGLPSWVQDVSPFRLVGAPLATGIDAPSLALFLLITLALVGSSILSMQRRDVGA